MENISALNVNNEKSGRFTAAFFIVAGTFLVLCKYTVLKHILLNR